jgi:hypothetical protein
MTLDDLCVSTKSRYKDKFSVGYKFGNWELLDSTVYKTIKKSSSQPHFHVKCECGIIKYLALRDLLRQKYCRKCAPPNSPRQKASSWKGVGELSNEYFHSVKKRAKKKGMMFEIDKRYLWDLFVSQDRRCALTEMILTFQTRSKVYDGTASLDRIDSDLGYIKGNVQWVHKTINVMKLDLTQEEFIQMCKLVANNN